MGLGDIFKAGQYKNEIEALKQENSQLQSSLEHAQSLLTPEMQDAQKLHVLIDNLKLQKTIFIISKPTSPVVYTTLEILIPRSKNVNNRLSIWMTKFLFRTSDYIVRIMLLLMHWIIKNGLQIYVQDKRSLSKIRMRFPEIPTGK